MKFLFYIVLFFPFVASAIIFEPRAIPNQYGLFRFQGTLLGSASIAPTDLDNSRKNFGWGSNSVRSNGTFDQMSHSDVGLGILLGPGYLMFHYFQGAQELKVTDITGTTSSVQDSFVYKAKYIFYDIPLAFGDFWLSFGVGIGKAEKFDFHQRLTGSTEADVTWSANPIGYRVRSSVGYVYKQIVGIYFEAGYEMIKSELTASSDYSNVAINGRGIEAEDDYENTQTGKNIEVDMSGGRFGLGLILMF